MANAKYTEIIKSLAISDLSENVQSCKSKRLFDIHIEKYYKNYINYLRCINRYITSYYAFNLDKTNLITTVFKVIKKDEDSEVSTIYGYLFSKWETIGYNKEYVHQYISTSPTFTSQDGEFRHRFNRYDLLQQIKVKYSDVYNIIDEYITEKMSNGELSFYCEFFYPKQLISNKELFEEQINRERLTIFLFANAWMCDFYNFMTKATENHMNVAYADIILDPSGEKLFNKLVDSCVKYDLQKSGIKNLKNIINQINTVNLPSVSLANSRLRNVEFGQKIIPMHINEASNLYNIRYGVWREMYISQLCADLVINQISPSFPLVESWFLIQNSHASLFDNISMYDKHANAQLAHNIGKDLIDLNLNNFIQKNKSKGYINDKFFRLSTKFMSSVNYIEEKLDLSNISICFQMEYLGRTWKDMPYLAQNVERSQITDLFSSYDTFSKIMFDYVYGLLCMNVKLGILHGDLHLNNATFYKIFDLDKTGDTLENPLCVYIINDGQHNKAYFNLNTVITQNISKFAEKSPSITISVEDYIDGGNPKSYNEFAGEFQPFADDTFNENLNNTLEKIINEETAETAEISENAEPAENSTKLEIIDSEVFAHNIQEGINITDPEYLVNLEENIKHYGGANTESENIENKNTETNTEANAKSENTESENVRECEKSGSAEIEEELYVFKTNGTFGCIIDFSRSIIGNLDKIVSDFGYMVAVKFKKEQRIRAIQIIKNNFTKFFEKHENNIVVLSIENFALLFKILSAIDIYSLSKNTKINLSNIKNFEHNKEIDNLVYYIQTLSEKYILSNLLLAFDRKIVNPEDIEWPNLVIMREAFSKYRYNTTTIKNIKGEIIDIYNYTNEIKYSTKSPSQLPPYLDYDNNIRKTRISCGLEDPDFIIESKKHKLSINEQANESLDLNMILDIDHLNKLELNATMSSPF